MESVSAAVLRAFGLKCRSAVRHRTGFVCATDQGQKTVIRVSAMPERIWFQYSVKEHLCAHGFTQTDRLALAESGEPYTELDGELYIVAERLPYREVSFAGKDEWLRVVQTVARFHFLCRDTDYACAALLPAEEPAALYRKHTDSLNRCRRRILKNGKYAEFDVLFLRTVDEYLAALAEWYETAATERYAALFDEARRRRFVQHGLLKEGNILISRQNDVALTDFSEAALGHYLVDLAALIKRYIKTIGCPVALSETLAAYDSCNPLCDDALRALRALLLFPDKYLRLCASYYDRNRSWTPGTFITRMETLAQRHAMEKLYISGFRK